ncbi:MAG: LapA family protein [Desulfobacterales bacterium]|nr:LapA family protein [Desulfobacterales bacterium]MBS3754151.1 LapA family protein [Desulfobacterales bacterium]
MKKVKYVFWLVVIGLVGLVVYQNSEFFIVGRSLGIDLYFFSYDSPELPTGVYYLAVFLIGMLISYFFTLAQKFRDRKTIRQLNEKVAAGEKKIAALESAPGETPQAQQQSPQSRQAPPQQQQGTTQTPASEAGGEKNEEKPGE